MPPITPPNVIAGNLDVNVVLDNTSDAVLLLNQNWQYTYVNHAAELLLRRKSAALLGKVHWDAYPELIGTPAEQSLRAAVASGRPCVFQQFIPSLYAWHSVKAVPTRDDVLLFLRDVTERARATRSDAVRESIRSILEDVPVAVTITRGAEHRIELQNASSRGLLNGRNVEGETVRNALPEAASQGFLAILDRVYASRQAFAGTNMRLKYDRDGSGRPYDGHFDITYQPIFDTDGEVSGILHLGVDVSERKRERDLLERYGAERDATLSQLTEGVIITDREGRISFINERARQLHGAAVLGVAVDEYTSTYQLLTPDGAPYPPEQLPLARAVLHNEFVEGVRWRIRRPDGTEIMVEGSAQPVFGDQQQKIACVLVMRPASERNNGTRRQSQGACLVM